MVLLDLHYLLHWPGYYMYALKQTDVICEDVTPATQTILPAPISTVFSLAGISGNVIAKANPQFETDHYLLCRYPDPRFVNLNLYQPAKSSLRKFMRDKDVH